MTNYEIYELIAEELEDRVDSGEITLEFAESVNDLAYDRWVNVDEATAATKHYEREAEKHGRSLRDELAERKRELQSKMAGSDGDGYHDPENIRAIYALSRAHATDAGHKSGKDKAISKSFGNISRSQASMGTSNLAHGKLLSAKKHYEKALTANKFKTKYNKDAAGEMDYGAKSRNASKIALSLATK